MSLSEVIKASNAKMELFIRGADGEIIIDIDNNQVLNSAGLPNPHYNKVIHEFLDVQKKHPIMCAVYNILYYATHLKTASKVASYSYGLLREKTE